MDEADLRRLAGAVLERLGALIPDPVEAARVGDAIRGALALPEGPAAGQLTRALMMSYAVRAWVYGELTRAAAQRAEDTEEIPVWAPQPLEEPMLSEAWTQEWAASPGPESGPEPEEGPYPDARAAPDYYEGFETLGLPPASGASDSDEDWTSVDYYERTDSWAPRGLPVPPAGGWDAAPGNAGAPGNADAPGNAGAPEKAPSAGDAEQRSFVAEIEDHPVEEPLRPDEWYTIAFSVGDPSDETIAASAFADAALAAAWQETEQLELTVQLDFDAADFKIRGPSVQPLLVPRTGNSVGKARFSITPLSRGYRRLTATVCYRGNFVQQLQVTLLVGRAAGQRLAVSSRGRPADSAVALEPRDMSLVLEPASPLGFTCTAGGSVRKQTRLSVTREELDRAVTRARQAMLSVIQSRHAGSLVFQAGIDIPEPARDEALRTLARAGALLFKQLFEHPGDGADARLIGQFLREQAADPDCQLTIQVVADQAPLPWAMLYLGDAAEGAALDWNNFLGMRHVIEQLPLQQTLATTTSRIPSRPRLSVGLNVNDYIDVQQKITLVAAHRARWLHTAAARRGLALIPRSSRSEVVRALADPRTDDQVMYFYCHAKAGGSNGTDPMASEIIMGRSDRVSLADLDLDAPRGIQLAGNPLVFINACESAELSPLFYNGFVPYFMDKGARGVIGTECRTPVVFAIEWANAFFDEFLDGAKVGETVLRLRQRFLLEHGNPLGLVYAVHCDADTRVAPALGMAPAR